MKRKYPTIQRPWTFNEIELLVELFPDNYTNTICEKLDRNYSSVAYMASRLKLKKSKQFRQTELKRQGERLRTVGIRSQYPKGHIPANKGQKMPEHVYEKCKATMFKKGQNPHNIRPEGHERINVEGYVEIRIRKSKYVLKHRWLWEQKNGKIPEGMIVVFKDRNPKNITIQNLELISKKENMLRNTIHRFPKELTETIRIVNKIKRTIHAKEQN